jgi:methanogenic corrinoid protein MtbC1
VSDEVVTEPLALEELAVGRQVVVSGPQEGSGPSVESLDLQQHADELRVEEAVRLGDYAAQPAAAGVLQPALLAPHAHAHLGATHLDAELAEELAQPGVALVVDDGPAVGGVPPAVRAGDVVGVRVTAEPVLRLEDRDVVGTGKEVGSGQAGDSRPDDGKRRPPGVRGCFLGGGADGGRRAVGVGVHEAARAVLGEDSGAEADLGRAVGPDRAPSTASELPGALRRPLDTFDEPAAQAVLDRLVFDLSLTTVLRDVVVPYLAELGERWEQGTASVAQEHFASNVIRGRLAGLARGWGNGHGPRAVLACPPGELHDLALMVFGIVLNRNGWRIDYLGMSTPVEELTRAVDAIRPDLVVLAATMPENLEPLATQLTALAQRAPLVLAGAGATPEIAGAVGARLLAGDPVTEAGNVEWPR